MKIYHCQGKHCAEVFDYFDFKKLDPFYDQNVLSALFDENWNSILIVDENKNAFLNVYVLNEIEGTDYYDIEPYFGNSGPILNCDDIEFANMALDIYSNYQKKQNIIAEFFRFNPIYKNERLFINSRLRIFGTKKIVIVDCFEDEEMQIKQYSQSRRRIIRRANETFEFHELISENELDIFINMYNNTMDRVAAEKKWYFDNNFYSRLGKSDNFRYYAAVHNNKIISTIIHFCKYVICITCTNFKSKRIISIT